MICEKSLFHLTRQKLEVGETKTVKTFQENNIHMRMRAQDVAWGIFYISKANLL